MKKRGQVAVFIILALLIIIIVMFLIYLRQSTGKDPVTEIKEGQIDDSNLRKFVQSCVDSTSKKAVFYLGFVGGNLQEDVFENFYNVMEDYKIPYYYFDKRSYILDEEGFKTKILAQYMKENLQKCTAEFKDFKYLKVTEKNPEINVVLGENEVIFNVKYPIKIDRGFLGTNLESSYQSKVPARLKEIISIAQEIVKREVENERYIHWDYMNEATSRGYNITAYTEKDSTIVYRIVDLKSEIDDEFYVFQWANRMSLR